ncbi:hypothetical protein JR316_0008535 [Psilocybe cubensis]|uniref:F-box domain-containing protein n=2 Tax=Psilocybe cubensis TaxID=181762 RepID=A0A8H8CEF8_PSICU|nr:hypothetical protein JR316_0008535 [Psilocybe cubensis]KAH9479938.1 hypothetical protein JR316_0008535 [Psilocybe cubensis]
MSQVCSSWRNSILLSPNLWGQVVNFNRLGHPEWRNEVLRRTRDASLFLYGDVVDDGDGEISTILINNWQRICRLELRLVGFTYHDKIRNNERLWETLGSCSPSIEVFALWFFNYASRENKMIELGPRDQIISPRSFRLFGGYAPCLSRYDSPNIRFDTSPGILTSRLQHLRLEQPSNANEILNTIICIPTLVTLSVSHLDSSENLTLPRRTKDSRVFHTKLQRIELMEPMNHNAYIILLSSIEPAENHSLIIHCCQALAAQNTEAQVAQIGDILYRYASLASKSIAAAIESTLWIENQTFQIFWKGPGSEYNIQISDPAPQHSFSLSLLRRFPIPGGNCVREVYLILQVDTNFYSSVFETLAPVFMSVKKLSAPERFFLYMADLSEQRFVSAFPKLETIVVKYSWDGNGGDNDSEVSRYVFRRKEMGMLVPTVLPLVVNLQYL